MHNSRFLKALRGVNTGRPPVWFMRQAGRYMPSYRSLKQKYSFLEMCRHPELIAAITTMPIEQLGVDAAILFADILLLAPLLGISLEFHEGLGPILSPTLDSAADIKNLPNDLSAVIGHFQNTVKAIISLKKSLKVPLIGFAASPFTLACYLIEGKTTRDFAKTKKWLMRDPESFHKLLQLLTDYTIAYLQLQIDAGVDALQLFDSWAHVLPCNLFTSVSASYTAQIRHHLPKTTPLIFFCRGTGSYMAAIANAGPQAISVDWSCDLVQARALYPEITLQGNMDPAWLYAPLENSIATANEILDAMSQDPAYIFNFGHGIPQDVSVDAVRAIVDTVKAHEPARIR